MTARRVWLVFALALLPLFGTLAADDPAGDALPAGAKFRLGTARMRGTTGSPTAITPDGKYLVGNVPSGGTGFFDFTGKIDRTVRIDGEYGTVHALSADSKRGLCASFQGAFVWDTASGKILAKAPRNTPSSDNGVSLSSDGKFFAVGGAKSFSDKDKDKLPTVVIWDVDANKQVALINPAQNETAYVSLSPNGKRLATWGYHYERNAKEPLRPEADPGRLVQFWDASNGKELSKARLLTGYNPVAVVFAPDGSLAAASGGDGTVHLIDPATGTEKNLLLARSRQGRKLMFSPDGKTIAASGEDGSIQRWNVATGQRLGLTEAPVGSIYGVRGMQFTDNERIVAWAGRGSATIVWEAPSGKLLTQAGGHFNNITGSAVAGGGKELFTGASDGMIIRWDPTTGKELGTIGLKLPAGGFGTGFVTSSVTISPDGTRALALDTGSSGIGIYDLPAGTQQFVIPGDFNRQVLAHFTTDGTKVVQVMTSYDVKKNPPKVAVWDVPTAKKLIEVELPELTQVAAALAPDGKTLITAGVKPDAKRGDGEFFVTGWEVGTNKKRGEFKDVGGFGSVYLTATGDSKTAFVVSPRSGPIIVDFTNGTKVRDIELEGRRVASTPVMGPDGKTVAIPLPQTFGEDRTSSVLLLDVESGKVKKTLSGISGTATAITFSPDGKMLITGSYDTTALVWDISGQ